MATAAPTRAPKRAKPDVSSRLARLKTFGQKVKAYLEAQQQNSENYALMDGLSEQIIAAMVKRRNKPKRYAKGKAVVLEDQYAAKNKVWKSTGIDRFKIVIVDV